MLLKDIMFSLEKLYPTSMAEDWDNVGLILGNENSEIKNIMTCLEITQDVIDEAIEKKINLIVSHHPVILKRLSNLNEKDSQNNKIIKLIKNDINVYSMHTNVDIAINGMNDWLADEIELKEINTLRKNINQEIISTSVCVNPEDIKKAESICAPFAINMEALYNEELELQDEVFDTIKIIRDNKMKLRLDFVILKQDSEEFQQIMISNQIFDFQFIELKNEPLSLGMGRIGTITETTALNLGIKLKKTFNTNINLVGSKNKKIKKVGVIGGSGMKYLKDAINSGCDAFITGDINYHDSHFAIDNNIVLFDIGHNSEEIFKYKMKDILYQITDCRVCFSNVDTNPFTNI